MQVTRRYREAPTHRHTLSNTHVTHFDTHYSCTDYVIWETVDRIVALRSLACQLCAGTGQQSLYQHFLIHAVSQRNTQNHVKHTIFLLAHTCLSQTCTHIHTPRETERQRHCCPVEVNSHNAVEQSHCRSAWMVPSPSVSVRLIFPLMLL